MRHPRAQIPSINSLPARPSLLSRTLTRLTTANLHFFLSARRKQLRERWPLNCYHSQYSLGNKNTKEHITHSAIKSYLQLLPHLKRGTSGLPSRPMVLFSFPQSHYVTFYFICCPVSLSQSGMLLISFKICKTPTVINFLLVFLFEQRRKKCKTSDLPEIVSVCNDV